MERVHIIDATNTPPTELDSLIADLFHLDVQVWPAVPIMGEQHDVRLHR